MRSSMELLAPAGGPEQLSAAVAAGADAMFCGFGHRFNARRGATSFDDETFSRACKAAHLAGARVYVTANVVIKTNEMQRALAMVHHVWLLGADAFIIQDWGLVSEVRSRWPQIEVHVSTQANVHDSRGVAWCRDLWGVHRVTLSRELSIPEITRIAQEGVELEGFAHGALCFSYSGICMMSAMAGDRSANRGACAQPCRLPYELVDGSGASLGPADMRPLCPKDFRTIDRLDQLRDAGLKSLKLEGRLKGSDYVYAVVRAYRAALDELASREARTSTTGETGGQEDVSLHKASLVGDARTQSAAEGRIGAEASTWLMAAERERLLRRAFNRDFTDAYLDGRSGNEMMSYERSNNRGELVGSVVGTRDLGSSRVWRGGTNGGRERSRKVTLAEVDVLLNEPVGKGDLLEIRPLDDPSQFLTAHADRDAAAGETITCRTPRTMPTGCPVRVIRSQQALDEGARAAKADVPRQRAVHVRIVARLGEPFTVQLTCTDGAAHASASGFVVEAARTRAVSEQDLIDHVGRMGGSTFCAASFEVELDEGCGMRFSDVHKVRTEACRALTRELLAPYEQRTLSRVPSDTLLARQVRERLEAVSGGVFDATQELADGKEVKRPAMRAGDGASGSTALMGSALCKPVVDGWQPTSQTSAVMHVSPARVEVCALVRDAAAARAAQAAGATRIYATPDALATDDWAGEQVIPWLDEVCREIDHERLDPLVYPDESVAVGSVSELSLAVQRGAYAEIEPCIPVHNPSAMAAMVHAGATAVWLSPEMTMAEVLELAALSPIPLGLIVYGHARSMTSEHCVLQAAGRCIDDCARCPLRQQDMRLVNQQGKRFPVRTDLQGRSRIYAAEPLDAAPEVADLLAGGVTRLLVDGSLLSAEEMASQVARICNAVTTAQEGKPMPTRLSGHTSGHLHKGIE